MTLCRKPRNLGRRSSTRAPLGHPPSEQPWRLASLTLTVMALLAALGSAQDPTSADPIGHPRTLSPTETAAGWISLFDGETLFGWQTGQANWQVDQGRLIVTEGPSPEILATTTQFDCYRLRVDFWASDATNSGVFLRTSPKPSNPTVDCIELNIAPRTLSPFPTGSLVGREATETDFSTGVWHRFEVDVLPESMVVLLDGQPVLDCAIERPLGRGFVGLQYNQGEVRFCNVFLKPLNLNSLFNGSDLRGWRTYPQLATEASVTDEGELRLSGGRGQIESVSTFGDFVLQLEARTLVEGTNSGVFFRCIPTEEMNGYEAQIHNATLEGDPRRPADCGTGGIFRRVDARRVNASDDEWFAMTLVAVGPDVSVWVNGLLVTSWRDDREADANPRRGLRLAPGTIMLQGHDPDSQILFRNLNATELAQRVR